MKALPSRTSLPFIFLFVLSIGFLVAQTASSQSPSAAPDARSQDEQHTYRAAMEKADQEISEEVKSHSELMKNLEYLTTHIGARLTGSPQMNVASDWTVQRFKDYGIETHLETTEIPHSWTRG